MFSKLGEELAFMFHGIQIVSLIGAACVLISFLCRGEKKLRTMNTIGCVFCIAYSILVQPQQWSNFILNTLLFVINVYHLIKLNKENKDSKEQPQKDSSK